MEAELKALAAALTSPERPVVAFVGGAKVSSKLGALRNMIDRVDKLIIGGAMANTFLKSLGRDVGKSRVEDDLLDTAKELVKKAAKKGVNLYLPVDCIAADRFDARAETKQTTVQEVPSEWMILDIGPATTTLFGEALEDASFEGYSCLPTKLFAASRMVPALEPEVLRHCSGRRCGHGHRHVATAIAMLPRAMCHVHVPSWPWPWAVARGPHVHAHGTSPHGDHIPGGSVINEIRTQARRAPKRFKKNVRP